MAKILSGTEVSASIDEKLIDDVNDLKKEGITPCICVVRIGERPQDLSYERGLLKKAEKIGIEAKICALEEGITQQALIEEIKKINEDKENHGILLFRPLPKGFDEKEVLKHISPEKDLDGVTDASMLGIYSGKKIGNPPCTARACMEILKHYDIEIAGKKAVVLGRSLVIGKPVAAMLLEKNATVTICHSKSENIQEICKGADILIVAVGRANMLDASYLSEGQIVIDVGINMGEDGKLYGDVNFDEAQKIVGAITPVPRGVGSVTSSVLMSHVVGVAIS